MSKRNKSKVPEPLTPEKVIRSRIRRLADREDVTSFVTKLIIMAAFLVVLFGKIFGITPMKNNDMSPRISSGDLLLYYRLEDEFRSGDVVVLEKDGRQYVGRVIAKNGDEVEITDDATLLINGSHVYESDIFYKTQKYGDEQSYPMALEDNQYFVLCDYREGAKDSRFYGAVEFGEIKGKIITIIRRSNL